MSSSEMDAGLMTTGRQSQYAVDMKELFPMCYLSLS